jgi:hypothetical protein
MDMLADEKISSSRSKTIDHVVVRTEGDLSIATFPEAGAEKVAAFSLYVLHILLVFLLGMAAQIPYCRKINIKRPLAFEEGNYVHPN